MITSCVSRITATMIAQHMTIQTVQLYPIRARRTIRRWVFCENTNQLGHITHFNPYHASLTIYQLIGDRFERDRRIFATDLVIQLKGFALHNRLAIGILYFVGVQHPICRISNQTAAQGYPKEEYTDQW